MLAVLKNSPMSQGERGGFTGISLTLLYESALMPANHRGTPVGGRRALRSSSPPPGIDRGGGFCLGASGEFAGAISVAMVGSGAEKD